MAQQLSNESIRLQERLVKLQLKENGDYTVKKEYKNIDFHTADAVKVRIMNLPIVFDDKGNRETVHEGRAGGDEGQGQGLAGL